MRFICLITVGAVLLTIADVARTDEQVGEITETTGAARVPRALILQPVSKIREDDDDSPFDWLADMFKGMMSSKPRVRVPLGPPPMIGPIKIPGVNDEVFIKQLGGFAHTNPRVIVRVMNHQNGPVQTPMGMAIQPSQYFTYQPTHPVAPTNQVPMQPSGFVPMQQQHQHQHQHHQQLKPNPTAAWPSRPHSVQRPHYPLNYNKNPYPNGGYNYSPQYSYPHQQQRYPQPQPPPPSHQAYYDPFVPRYNHQNPYGSYDFDNSLQHSGRGYHYSHEALRSTSYPQYAPLKDHSGVNHDSQENRNETLSSGEVYDNSHETTVQYTVGDHSKEDTSANSGENFKEIYRPDRMVPTNPTWRNRFWTKTLKTTTASPTTEKNDSEKRRTSTKEKFSATEIKEIVAPDMRRWKEKHEKPAEKGKNSDSRMDEDGIQMSDGKTLGKGESQEFIEKRNFRPTSPITRRIKISSKKRQHWKPTEAKPTRPSPVYIHSTEKTEDPATSSSDENDSSQTTSSETVTPRVENATPEVLQKVMNLTADQGWKNEDKKKSSKTYQRKTGMAKSNNRRVRIVESVQSSVSMTSSKGKQSKTKSKS